ncbi:hypothetical protein VdG1_08804 [Verticillium dahliae VDG1]|nr:hypothetical protein VdG1_08804 [Verticillium dahliae VDG1]
MAADLDKEQVSAKEHQAPNTGSLDPELAEAIRNFVPGTSEEKKLVKKIDLFLMPMLWIMYILNYIDRTNIGNAKIAGMGDDLALDDNEYAWVLSIFFFGYLICEIPSNMILSRTAPSIFLPGIMFIWGGLCAAMAVVTNYGGLLGFRFVLGCVEAGFFPGVLYLLSCWYTKAELGKRFAIFYTAAVLSGAFGGLLAGAITSNLDDAHGIAGWRWLFIIEGVATVGVAYMTVPVYAVAAVVLNIVAWSSDRHVERRFHIAGALALGCACAIVCAAVQTPMVRYVMLCFVAAGIWSALPLILSWTSGTVSMPPEKRAIVLAMVNAFGNFSSVYGSRIWPSTDRPAYHVGWGVTAAFLGSGMLLALVLPILCKLVDWKGTRAERELLEGRAEDDASA